MLAKLKKKYISARSGEYDKTLCEDRKAHEMVEWNPVVNLDDYIKDAIEK